MSSSLLLQPYPACLVHLIWMVLEMGSGWSYSRCLVVCCFHELFSIVRRILVQLPSSLFSIRFVNVYVVHAYSSMNTTAAWKKLRFMLLDGSDFHMTDNQSIAYLAFASRVLMSFSINETLL